MYPAPLAEARGSWWCVSVAVLARSGSWRYAGCTLLIFARLSGTLRT
jgi:hypothetical protein